MQKYSKPTGSTEARLVQAMRRIGYNVDVDIQFAVVVSPPPNIKIRMETDGHVFSAGDLVVAGHLAEHRRLVTIGGTPQLVEFSNALQKGDRVIVACMDEKQQWVILDKAVTY